MEIRIKGARENNLKDIDLTIGDGLTVVTGVSGSGKTSLVFDTLYHEARRRFQEVFTFGSPGTRLTPALVDSITGLGPAVAVGQNLLNRNPGSTLATASGLHPFLRLLYARFGERHCRKCGSPLTVSTDDEIVEKLASLAKDSQVTVFAPLMKDVKGGHETLLELLVDEFGSENLVVDSEDWYGNPLESNVPHIIDVLVSRISSETSSTEIREVVHSVYALGASTIKAINEGETRLFSGSQVCHGCGTWFNDLEPTHFNQRCPHCKGEGCPNCLDTGLRPEAASVTWAERRFTELLSLSVDEADEIFNEYMLPSTGNRLMVEIRKRLDALIAVGLDYVSLDRSSPTLSRGESQRVRLAVSLTSKLEDILHVLDEPTIGQHPADVSRLIPAFRRLAGPVVYVEHDRIAVAQADQAVDIGPGAGLEGGEIVFTGSPRELWSAETSTGEYFSLRKRVEAPVKRSPPRRFLELRRASQNNLRDIDVRIPVGRLTVVTGVSGSGKSTLVEDVIHASLKRKEPVGCEVFEGGWPSAVMVDQSPIGKNPRSTPSTYTKVSDIIRNLYAEQTGLTNSHFSFNRPEGACPTCKGMGSIEVQMRYLPSTWIRCGDCEGRRFNDDVLEAKVCFGELDLSISDFNRLSIREAYDLIGKAKISPSDYRNARRMLKALLDIGLGYLTLSQPSPTLSGGEAQRVKLAKYLGRGGLSRRVIILDEPSTGLHPKDLAGLLTVLDRLVKAGATVIVVEHNTDVIRAADWVIDLGPGAGPSGGEVVYMGSVEGLIDCVDSETGKALREESSMVPRVGTSREYSPSKSISIRGAKANNLRNIDVDIPKGKLTVVTGVSGSGKSSLVADVLEAEARRRFLETLSLYERQGTKEGPEAPVDSVTGLGVSLTVTPDRRLYDRRSTVGTATEIWYHLAALFASCGERTCLECGANMRRGRTWVCPQCGDTAMIASPRRFNPTTYGSACITCHGVGTLQNPRPDKLMRNPEKPLCGGAMYSPGFFPQGYLCKPGNGGYDVVQAFAQRHGFDPASTPWQDVPEEVRNMFMFGDPAPLEVTFTSPKGRTRTSAVKFNGFYGWIRDWDVGGTYTDTVVCATCLGKRFRPEYLAVRVNGNNIHELNQMPLNKLKHVIDEIDLLQGNPAYYSLETMKKRLQFLNQVGLGYVNLDRVSGSLSAGEAQRVKLAGLLGTGLTNLTILLDEPSRGLHPSEVNALMGALEELRDEGNTVVVVEHDLEVISKSDYLIDMGPGAGTNGGLVVAQGTPEEVSEIDTVTGRWLKGKKISLKKDYRTPSSRLTIKGARENNLKEDNINMPLGIIVGVCGVSGSGKSTLMIDTIGRALSPVKQTTSVAREPVDPGAYESIEGAPKKTIQVDQSKRGIRSPYNFLDLSKPLAKVYADCEDAKAMGLDVKTLGERCTVCRGGGSVRIDMGFLPDVNVECEACQGTGYTPEAWDVRLHGYALPEVTALTIEETYNLFKDEEKIARSLKAAIDVGLGYLVMRQPGYSLSGGEAQRLKIAKELSKKTNSGSLYILDEPTVGLHLEDVERLIDVLNRLVDEGNSVIVIEHHPHMLASCDYLLELGPGGGPDGGRVVAQGTPTEISNMETATASYIREILEESS